MFFLIFTPILGEDEPILTSIFFKGVGSNTSQGYFAEFEGGIGTMQDPPSNGSPCFTALRGFS